MSSHEVDFSRNILNRDGVEVPDTAPPTNHGHTPAAWFLTIFCIIGTTIVGVAMVMNSMPLIIVGSVVTVVGAIGGGVLSLAGKGQPRTAPVRK
ncbi:HGxxPAAW family protein [Timonella sp. A28]|uniref:HGxxPAAW family protein n=1 Tax=Timonella sp. A28 TaxID=3442640 RepID=UPI003EB7D9AE